MRPALRHLHRTFRISLLTGAVLLGACDNLRRVAEEILDTRTARERYVDGLAAAGLSEAALVMDWAEAADRSLRNAPRVSSPHVEEGYLPPGEPAAIAVRTTVRRGQEIAFQIDLPGDSSTTVFLDVWVVDSDSTLAVSLVESADSGERTLRYSPRRDGDVIFRAQPELLRGGRFRASVRIDPTLAFPVRSGGERDVGSRFGAPRDGGARSHHGIDIFASRGTPVIAAADAYVNRVQETAIGGRVVWLRDVNGNSLYYAHLDRQAVTSGQRVLRGDTIGFVGNTGNARTTPPHLHFGVYRRGEGPVDPWWFVYRPRGDVPRLIADTSRLGEWIRAPGERTMLRFSPSLRADTVAVLPRHTAMRVLSAAGEWYRVRLPNGTTGFISARLTEPADNAVHVATLTGSGHVLSRPEIAFDVEVMALLTPGDSLDVLARFGDFLMVRSVGGLAGWVAEN
jgi:murein DD-endopeptidase MepM/ murein hydrolase activator NlpD